MKTLIVINGSKYDQHTIDFGMQFVRRTDTPPVILLITRKMKEDELSSTRDYLDGILNKLDISAATSMIKTGKPVSEIVQVSQEISADFAVIGEWPKYSLARFFARPVDVQVARMVTCPILFVKGKARPVHRILLCDSGAGMSHVLNRFTVQLADMLVGKEEVTVLHVMSQMSAGPRVLGEELLADTDQLIKTHTLEGELLEYDIEELNRPGLQAAPKVRHGLVVDEILNEAKNGDYDLLVIGAHNVQKMPEFLLENIAQEILVRADRSVLIVR